MEELINKPKRISLNLSLLPMRLKRFLSSMFLFVLIFSCSCEDDEVALMTYPSFYHKAGVMSSGSMRVFISNGEIKDRAIVNRLAAYDTTFYNQYLKYWSNTYGFLDSINFFDSKHATLDHEFRDNDYLPSQEGNLLVLTGIDIVKDMTYREVMSRTLPYYIGRVKPEIYSEYLTSSTRGDYYFGVSLKRKFVFTKSGQQLVAPIIQFGRHLIGPDGVYTGTYFGIANNVLQPDFYKNLAVGDTVTLVESLMRFEK